MQDISRYFTEYRLLIVAVIAISLLLVLIIWRRWSAFVALLFVSILAGLGAGMSPQAVLTTVEKGMASTLGQIAIVIGLGAMFGRMLEISGGAARLAQTLLATFGERRAQWALVLTGFLVSIPVFLDVALVILIPIVYSLSKRTNRSLLYFGVPLLAGLGVSHSMIPPTPGPATVAALLGADMGHVVLFGTIAGIPAAIVAGPIFGSYIARQIHAVEPAYMSAGLREEQLAPGSTERQLPSFGLVMLLIVLPIALIVAGSFAKVSLADGGRLRETLVFLGHPVVALLLVALLSFYTLGKLRGYSREEVQDIVTRALEPAGIIILITGAGGVFKQILVDSGVGKLLGTLMKDSSVPPVVFGFAVAAFIRVAQGSATVAMTTAAGIIKPVLDELGVKGMPLGLVATAIACGATVVSHVNDSGFWLVNRFFGLSVKDTLRSWTVLETLIGVVGFAVVLILSLFIR